ncbi:MAG: hypothetical protein D6813_08080 [Calditrichaeota bacterium]|nr:MAG: hypothetical protein D6813_08080 [Calditrichota bacterium]
MKNLVFIIAYAFFMMNFGCDTQKQDLVRINHLGYSDVEYISSRDTVLTSTINGRIFIEVNGNKEKKLLTQVNDEIYDIIFSPINDYIFAATYQSGVIVIHKGTGKIVKRLQTPFWCTGLDLNHKENILAGACVNGNVYFWDINKGFERNQLSNKSPAFAVKFYNNDQNIVIAGYNISFWELDGHRLVKRISPHTTTIPAIDVDWQKKILVSCSFDKKASIIDLDNYSVKHSLSHPNFPIKDRSGKIVNVPIPLALTSCKILNNKLVTAGADHTVRVWDVKTGELIKTYTGHPGAVSNIDFSFDQKQVASVGLKGELRFWNLE